MARNSLKTYRKKRDFAKTAEPEGAVVPGTSTRFVLHEHHASRLHFDLRLEMGGVLKSFAVPKGPSLDPKEKRLAVNTEDHPIQYLDFQGSIADGQYGAGEMRIWDTGVYALAEGGDPLPAYDRGRLRLVFRGEKLRGAFMLLRTARGDGRQWLLFKLKDDEAVADWTPARILPYGSRKEKPAAPEAPAPALPRMPTFSNLDKVYWPGEGYTKGDLIRYYDKVSGFILPHLQGRPLILKRYPNGIGRPPFFQHEIKNPPAWLATAEDREESRGRMIRYAICDNRESLLYLANLGVIPLHPFLSRVPRLERPDWTVFDLDPQDVPFDEVCRAALALKKLLDALGLQSFIKTSGSRGMHVFVPLKPAYTFEQSLSFAQLVGALAVKEEPGLFTVERSLKLRKRDIIYLDCMQNSRGKSMASVYCAREKPGATVSAALEWSEVKKKPDLADFTMETMPRRLEKKGDLFSGVLRVGNSLEPALARLDGLLRK